MKSRGEAGLLSAAECWGEISVAVDKTGETQSLWQASIRDKPQHIERA